jgi:hypothetical protein
MLKVSKKVSISLGEPVPILVPSLSRVRPLHDDETLPNLVNENASIEEGERKER